MSFKSVIIKGQWVTGENEYGYPVGERLPLHTPFQKFNWLKVNGLLSSEPPETLEAQQGEVEEVTEEITVTEESPLEEVEEVPAPSEEAVEQALETPVIDETPKPQAKGKKK